jgi:5-methylcytosine-specific restriction endonuclease McrA
MKIISRNEALSLGLTFYFTGKPCPYGHIAKRQISSYSCYECAKKNGKKHYENNKQDYINRSKKFYKEDPERIKLRIRAWARNNPEKVAASDARKRERNREKLRAYIKEWRLKNPERHRLLSRSKSATRRARKLLASGRYTRKDILDLQVKQRGRCACCKKKLGKDFHVDHVEPLARGGSNDKTNLQLLCPTCNLKKAARDPIQYMQSLGFLL